MTDLTADGRLMIFAGDTSGRAARYNHFVQGGIEVQVSSYVAE